MFVTLEMLENEGQLKLLQKASVICRLIIKSIQNGGSLAMVLNYWKGLAFKSNTIDILTPTVSSYFSQHWNLCQISR